MGVIFVGGVHGVGKGTHCQLFSERTGVQWFTASSLIKTEGQSAIALGTKAVVDPVGNQDLLLRSVRRVLAANPTILLDGHFTILNSQNCIVPVDVEVFDQLKLQGIVVLTDGPSRICDRLRQRDECVWAVADVSLHQKAEIAHAQVVATKLAVPMFLVEASDTSGFTKAIGAMLG